MLRWALPIIEEPTPEEKEQLYRPYPDQGQSRQAQETVMRKLKDMCTHAKNVENIFRKLKASIDSQD